VDLPELLGRLVFPALIIALAALSIAAHRIFQKSIARVPVALTVVAVIAYLAFEVGPRLRERYFGPLSVRSEPATFFGVGPDGSPTSVELQVYRGGSLVSSKTFEPYAGAKPAADRPLRLEAVPGYGFRVLSDQSPLGLLPLDAVSGVGLVAALPSAPTAPVMFMTKRVTAGSAETLGELGSSRLTLRFLGIDEDGHARVTLDAPELGTPSPAVMEIPHKDVRLQRFDGGVTFFVALPSADFRGDSAWAQFAVISASRPPIAAVAASKPGGTAPLAAKRTPDVAAGPPAPKPQPKRVPSEPKTAGDAGGGASSSRAGPL